MKMPVFVSLIFLCLSLPVLASEPATESTEQNNDEVKENDNSAEMPEPEPIVDNLKNRDLGEAFRNFRPSEDISADNAVAFPADI